MHYVFYDEYKCKLKMIDHYTLIPPLITTDLKQDAKDIIKNINSIKYELIPNNW